MLIDGYCTVGPDREYDLSVEDLLRALDHAGVDRAVIGGVPRCMAVANREGNEFIRAAAAAHAGRLIPTCTATPWLGAAGVREVERAVGAGARMLVLDPTVQGFSLADNAAGALFEAAGALDTPVYIHTGGYQYGTPCQLGMAADRFPGTVFVMGHAGSTDFKVDAVEVARARGNVYVETSLTRSFGAVSLVGELGDGRVVMGSAAPLNDLVFEWRQTLAMLSREQAPGFYGGTVASLVGAEPAV
jgi:predicted TIM-barrel fold metal-dependent hydrolase